MSELDDGRLWQRAVDGDAEAFGVLFDRHANAVYGYCFRRTADWTAAEDLTALVFLEAWRARARVVLVDGRALPWLLGVATNVIRSRWRARRRHAAALSRLPRPDPERDFVEELADRVDAEQQMRHLLADVRRLPRGELEVVALCAWSSLSTAETAAALGIPEATARTRLHRARKRLRAPAPQNELADRPSEGAMP
jgi:RNA polymerase sigma-70 factor (ECF subfamily)